MINMTDRFPGLFPDLFDRRRSMDLEIEDIVRIGYSVSAMCYNDCFSFDIVWKDGGILFSADLCSEEGERIEIEGASISEAGAEGIFRIFRENDTVQFLRNYVDRKSKHFVLDATMEVLRITWKDGVCLSANSAGVTGPPLRDYLTGIAEDIWKRYPKGGSHPGASDQL